MKYCTGVKTFYYALVPQNCIHLKGRTILTHDFNNWSFWHYIWSKSSIINLSKKTSKYLTYRKSEQLRTSHPPSDPCNHLSFLSVCWWSAGHFCRTSKSPRIYSRNVLFLESPLTFLWISSRGPQCKETSCLLRGPQMLTFQTSSSFGMHVHRKLCFLKTTVFFVLLVLVCHEYPNSSPWCTPKILWSRQAKNWCRSGTSSPQLRDNSLTAKT